MREFKDNEGRRWRVEVNVGTVKRVRQLLGVDLLSIVDGKLVESLIADPVLLCDVVYVVCKPEADAGKISDDDFGRAMAGDAIEHATKALLDDLVDFSPSPRDRANLGRVLQTTWGAMDKARDVIEARLNSGELDRIVDQALKSATASFGDVPASSVLTPND